MKTLDLIQELYIRDILREDPFEVEISALSFYPDMLSSLSEKIGELLTPLHFHFICPTDIASIPLATALSIASHVPMIPSCYDTLGNIAKQGQIALFLDASSSYLKRIQSAQKKLNALHIFVSHAIVLIEDASAEENPELDLGIQFHSLWNFKKIQNSYSKIHTSDIS